MSIFLLLLRIFTLIPHFSSLVAVLWTSESKTRISCLHLTARKCTAECQRKNHMSKLLVQLDRLSTPTLEKLAKNSPDSGKETNSKRNEEKQCVHASRCEALED